MNTGHTPGKWIVAEGIGDGLDVVSLPNRDIVCSGIKNQADAAILAAAKELAWACKLIDGYVLINTPSLRQVEKAIAKVEGE